VTPDPFDVGALLMAALDASDRTQADVAAETGMPASHLSRALRDPNTRPPTARRILAALGHHVEVAADKRRSK
jgi:DNA-binding phage protein